MVKVWFCPALVSITLPLFGLAPKVLEVEISSVSDDLIEVLTDIDDGTDEVSNCSDVDDDVASGG